MKKLSKKQKEWNIIKSKKRMKMRSKVKKYKEEANRKNTKKYGVPRQHKICAPEMLNLLKDKGQKTLDFFEIAIETIRKCKIREGIYFDLRDVKQVTADAIMYIIAFIRNCKMITSHKIRVSGNLPLDIGVRNYFKDIGFYSYVKGLQDTHPTDRNRFRISHGKKADAPLIGKICDFVTDKTGQEHVISTKRLYSMIVELMTNTYQHAYKKEITSNMYNHWYVFAEIRERFIHFVFLDTGAGIPVTVSYNLIERGVNLIYREDAAYIKSALLGENRTETKLCHRGKGLPGIYEGAKQGEIRNLTIISGNGRCDILGDGEIKQTTLTRNLGGTLFAWDFKIA